MHLELALELLLERRYLLVGYDFLHPFQYAFERLLYRSPQIELIFYAVSYLG
ncbi:unnamed protein product [Meloidogyne enterolobii]|uniref:Uncharacterized protein n=1 Tax=Meloidogyne enterolobii TaxID=390850 RepID=A0ACB1AV56_MELEN